MDVDLNVRAVKGFVEAHNAHDLDALAELVAEDVVIGSGADPSSAIRGRAAASEFWTGMLTAFPDHHFEPVAFTAQHDRVVAELEETGTMRGPLGPNPATGREFKVHAAFRFGVDADGRINAITSYFDMGAVGRQLDLVN